VKVSVVVPTFNRGPALADMLRRLMASELDEGDDLEIVVVDDGSVVPARETVPSSEGAPASRWAVRWLRQANGGPAAARNAGFRGTGGDLVLFIDDDILVPPDLVRAHVAAHRRRPGSAIFGLCPYAPDVEGRPFPAFLERSLVPLEGSHDGLVAMPTVASGQISVERPQFAAEDRVYSPEMVTPAAEEYELAFRLRERGIPILAAPGIVALHDQPVDVASYCRQQYKHGLGCGEAATKRPELLALPQLARIIEASRAGGGSSGLHLLKRAVTCPPARASLLVVARALERIPAPGHLRAAAYDAAISAHFVAGVKDGLARFAVPDGPGHA
jgi:cellulose synthase/poly-beta-1,6-N-acetylglucosamine synthase-like glycosyltransferase